MAGKKRKFGKPSTDPQKEHYLSIKGGVWDKQCRDCRWVYVKFHRECPKCESINWDLMNHVEDPDYEPGKSEIPYLPTPEQIKEECSLIRRGWDESRLATQENVAGWQLPEVLAQKKAPDEV